MWQAFSNTQKKLELKFRPEDKFCKGVIAERSKKTSFLLKVTVRRVKSSDENEPDKRIVTETAVVGRVSRIFTFKGEITLAMYPNIVFDPSSFSCHRFDGFSIPSHGENFERKV